MVWPFKPRNPDTFAVVGDSVLPPGWRAPSSSLDSTGSLRPTALAWQSEAWQLWDEVGELHAPTSYVARIVSRMIGWQVTFEGSTKTLDDEQTLTELKAAYGPATNLEELIRMVVLNYQVAGDMWLVQTGDPGTDEYGWVVLSVVTPNLARHVEDARRAGRQVRRIYSPHPVRPDEGDSAFRNVLEPAKILLAYDKLTRAQTQSRLAQAGILIVPSAMETGVQGDPFGEGLERVMTAAIADPDSPAAMVPIKIELESRVPRDAIKHITFDRPFDDKIPQKVEQAINRIALGLDIPPELIYGLGDMNHWTAWASQDETWRSTLSPLAEIVAGVHEVVLEIAAGKRATVDPDPTNLLARRSSVEDAIKGAAIGAVSLEYVRDAMGATGEDAATEEDLRIMAAARGSSASAAEPEQRRDAPQGGDPTGPEEA
jgi:hypothetical protein